MEHGLKQAPEGNVPGCDVSGPPARFQSVAVLQKELLALLRP